MTHDLPRPDYQFPIDPQQDDNVYENIMRWLKGEIPNLRVHSVLSRLETIELEDVSSLAVYSRKWPEIVDKITKELEGAVRKKLEEDMGETPTVDYYIRRNLLENSKNLQAEGFGFELDFSDYKATIHRLRNWCEGENLSEPYEVFLVVFVASYLVLNDELYLDLKTPILQLFWSDVSLEERQKGRKILYDTESWVYHPLNTEEESEYLLQRGKRILDQDRTLKNAVKKDREREDREMRTRILLSRTKLVLYGVMEVVRWMGIVSKTYTEVIYRKMNSIWNECILKVRSLHSEFLDIQRESIDMGIIIADQNYYQRKTHPNEVERAILDRMQDIFIIGSKLFERYDSRIE